MKNTNTIISAILAVAVVILFILHFSGNKKGASNETYSGTATEGTEMSAKMPVAYINIDSLLTNYTYAIELRDQLMRKMESSQATLNQQARALEKEMQEFQRKIENNAFFDQSRAQREQERIMKKQQEFQANSQKLQAELMQEEAEMNTKLRDTIMDHVEKYNAEIGKFQVIFSNAGGDNILYAEKAYDITSAVTKYLNDNYSSNEDSLESLVNTKEGK